jgi:DNA-binding LacI/PurR family transcriptional regulator
MQGICEEASRNDYDVMLVTTLGDNLGNLERMISNNKVDGVILSRSMVRDNAASFLKEQRIPFVLMGTSRDNKILQVDNDNKAGCSELVCRMLRSGLKRIGLIGGNKDYVVNRTRKQGFQEAYKVCRRQLDESLVFENCDKAGKIEFAVNKLIELGADGIVCMDDAICASVLQILVMRNIAVPEKIQVASFYDSTLLKNSKPAVTSLMFDDKGLGALTCKVLLKYIMGEDVKARNLMGYEIVERESTRI